MTLITLWRAGHLGLSFDEWLLGGGLGHFYRAYLMLS